MYGRPPGGSSRRPPPPAGRRGDGETGGGFPSYPFPCRGQCQAPNGDHDGYYHYIVQRTVSKGGTLSDLRFRVAERYARLLTSHSSPAALQDLEEVIDLWTHYGCLPHGFPRNLHQSGTGSGRSVPPPMSGGRLPGGRPSMGGMDPPMGGSAPRIGDGPPRIGGGGGPRPQGRINMVPRDPGVGGTSRGKPAAHHGYHGGYFDDDGSDGGYSDHEELRAPWDDEGDFGDGPYGDGSRL